MSSQAILPLLSPFSPALRRFADGLSDRRPIAADATAIQAKDGWYNKALVDFDFMRQNVSIPPKKGVVIIDSRPAARQYDPGHIPGAINIPDSQFDKLVDKLPADKATLLLFYCGGLECMLSHNSAFKAEKLGYTNIKVYPAGSPDWKAKGAQMSVSAAYLKKLMDDKAPYVLIDARPKRVADKGMIPTALNISDSEFDKHVDKLPADKATPLIYLLRRPRVRALRQLGGKGQEARLHERADLSARLSRVGKAQRSGYADGGHGRRRGQHGIQAWPRPWCN
jgi:rhodanese-related sulfurtransferase